MGPEFYLGIGLAFLFFPLGFALGFNSRNGEAIKRFNESKGQLLRGVIE